MAILKNELDIRGGARMKHNPFEELSEGFEALKNEHQGKVTLKQPSQKR
jgi:hypothetical protein